MVWKYTGFGIGVNMGKVLVMGSREIEFSEEIQETIYFDNVVAVLYRKDKEIPNNVIFF